MISGSTDGSGSVFPLTDVSTRFRFVAMGHTLSLQPNVRSRVNVPRGALPALNPENPNRNDGPEHCRTADRPARHVNRTIRFRPVDHRIVPVGHLDRLYAKVASDGRRLDVVVANVGAVDSVKLADVTIESFNHDFDVNARACCSRCRSRYRS
jgi:NAD(P)-dependent dehydrogenase (short-subunit alcohol dehydrogenase family)